LGVLMIGIQRAMRFRTKTLFKMEQCEVGSIAVCEAATRGAESQEFRMGKGIWKRRDDQHRSKQETGKSALRLRSGQACATGDIQSGGKPQHSRLQLIIGKAIFSRHNEDLWMEALPA
jgi:hypothetical protein